MESRKPRVEDPLGMDFDFGIGGTTEDQDIISVILENPEKNINDYLIADTNFRKQSSFTSKDIIHILENADLEQILGPEYSFMKLKFSPTNFVKGKNIETDLSKKQAIIMLHEALDNIQNLKN